MTDKADLTRARAGELFMLTLWLQGQMSDLLIFNARPDLVAPFLASPTVIPEAVVDLRTKKWESDFGPIWKDFSVAFDADLTEDEESDFEWINAMRNAIAHSHVSIGRDYLLYRPNRAGEKLIAKFEATSSGAPRTPPVLILNFFDDAVYLDFHNRITGLDSGPLARIAARLGVDHPRIR